MIYDHDNYINPTVEEVKGWQTDRPPSLGERLRADIDAGAHYSLERVAIQESLIALKTKDETDLDRTVTPEEAKKHNIKIEKPISPLEFQLRMQNQAEGLEIQRRFANNLSWSRPFSSLQSILTMGLIAGNTPSAKSMDFAIGGAFTLMTGPLGGLLAAGTHRAIRTVPAVFRALKTLSRTGAAIKTAQAARLLKQTTLQSDSIQNLKRISDVYNRKFKGSVSIGAANTLEEFMVASYDAEQGIDDPQASQYALAFFAPAVFKGVLNAAAGGAVRAEQRLFKPDVEKPKPAFKDEFTYEKVGEPLKDDAPDTGGIIKQINKAVDDLMETLKDERGSFKIGTDEPPKQKELTEQDRKQVFDRIWKLNEGYLTPAEYALEVGHIMNTVAFKSGGKATFELDESIAERLGLEPNKIMAVGEILEHIKKQLKIDEKTEHELSRTAKDFKRNEIIRKTLERQGKTTVYLKPLTEDGKTVGLTTPEGKFPAPHTPPDKRTGRIIDFRTFKEERKIKNITAEEAYKLKELEEIRQNKIKPEEILDDIEAEKMKGGELWKQILGNEEGAINPRQAKDVAIKVKALLEKFRNESGMKAVQELLARTDVDDLILMKANQRGRRKLQTALDEPTKANVRSLATFIKKPQRDFSKYKPRRIIETVQKVLDKSNTMTEVLIRMEGLDNIKQSAWNELLNIFSEKVITDTMVDVAKALNTAGIKFDSNDLFPILRSPDTVKARLEEFKRQNPHIDVTNTRGMGHHFQEFIEPDLRTVGEYLQTKGFDVPDKMKRDAEPAEVKPEVKLKEDVNEIVESGLGYGNIIDAIKDRKITDMIREDRTRRRDWVSNEEIESWNKIKPEKIQGKTATPEEQLKAIRKAVKPQKQEFDDYDYKPDGENEYGEAVDDMLTRSDEVIDDWAKCIEGRDIDGE